MNRKKITINGKDIKDISIYQVKTQVDAIKWHLVTYKSITSWTAIKEYGATRLSGIIFNLRKEGYSIQSNPETITTRFGRTTEIARYEYLPPVEQPEQLTLL